MLLKQHPPLLGLLPSIRVHLANGLARGMRWGNRNQVPRLSVEVLDDSPLFRGMSSLSAPLKMVKKRDFQGEREHFY